MPFAALPLENAGQHSVVQSERASGRRLAISRTCEQGHDWPLFKANFHLQKIYIEFEGFVSKFSEFEAGSDLLTKLFFGLKKTFEPKKTDFLRSSCGGLLICALSFENIPPHIS